MGFARHDYYSTDTTFARTYSCMIEGVRYHICNYYLQDTGLQKYVITAVEHWALAHCPRDVPGVYIHVDNISTADEGTPYFCALINCRLGTAGNDGRFGTEAGEPLAIAVGGEDAVIWCPECPGSN